MFFLYMALSAALTWPIIMGWLEVVAAAAGFFIFFAKAPGVETARMARPIRMVFFTISSLNLERHTLVQHEATSGRFRFQQAKRRFSGCCG
jgi:hypothetical protein